MLSKQEVDKPLVVMLENGIGGVGVPTKTIGRERENRDIWKAAVLILLSICTRTVCTLHSWRCGRYEEETGGIVVLAGLGAMLVNDVAFM